MEIYQDIAGLVAQSTACGLIEKRDQVYAQNQVLRLLKLETFPETIQQATKDSIPNLLEKLVAYAIKHHVITDVFDDKEILSANIMNCFVARPSVVEERFYKAYQNSARAATTYFYNLSKNSNYIQMNRIRKNIAFKSETTYGDMDITINLSKPEKDPEQIKREREMKNADMTYPTCLLCAENEGYTGRTGHPARANHRIIKLDLNSENWFLQYSPYLYYNEHCIVLSEMHRNMKIDRQTFANLLAFVRKFPHYFLGSNADLPIVGGSILTHDHYQGGHYEFAMTNASKRFSFSLPGFDEVEMAVLKWPLSVIRLHSKDTDKLVGAADTILQAWKNYSDPDADILAFTGDTPHNTITPIARKRADQFELDLVLRNNRTTEEHPLGIFHPHSDVHHIKKENIGLIEVMGLAVLPARLQSELTEIRKFLLGDAADVAAYHQAWAEDIKRRHKDICAENAAAILKKELGSKFARVLEDAGVFKQTVSGLQAFRRFLDAI
ncbi:UDP-glucose--hexose-1-phosphate uridylyltransferase [Virgibacillus sp. 179-BFC.A HS]|uniref:Galactose-1-phosphate uridylyltransferase n=1 Tax=Tigheibacillus jepli TaxID=3035914 RepID=A0ABU5CEP8_9BACI|nr:UDP-glucose--hexose-1-phosphate uridylyltransferase [Virgibacillus sp. 179-BFC.A HS]MDY0404808.1 UDP-glucose--hexose-1-phosphate uridylyltransferase [Virgibacillus sp. 179-BFC.A HS]